MSSKLSTAERAVGEPGPFADVEAHLLSMQGLVGRKWLLVIVHHLLADGPMGFSALKERIDDISAKMLSESLDVAETAGLVERDVVSDRPVRVEYDLTSRGRALEGLINEMARWSERFGDVDADEDGDR